jgi:hypothetical protein
MDLERPSELDEYIDSHFYRIFFGILSVFGVLIFLAACSSDVHGIRVDVIRKQPEIAPVAVTVQTPIASVPGGS